MTKEIAAHGSETVSRGLEPTVETGWSREPVKLIAKDVGEAVAMYIQLMYPSSVAAAPSTFKLSVRNCVFNEIMAAVDVSDVGRIEARLKPGKQNPKRVAMDRLRRSCIIADDLRLSTR